MVHPKQKAELWERWKSGQWVADVARALEERKRVSKTLHMHIVPAGQIRTEGCCVDQLNPPPIADIDHLFVTSHALAALLVRDEGVAGSNPATPTNT